MKTYTLLAVLVFAQASGAVAGLPCERIEYAQLKDSTRKELVDMYCHAKGKSEANEELAAIHQRTVDAQRGTGVSSKTSQRMWEDAREAIVSCLRVSESVSAMMAKKFNAKPPGVCKD